MQARLFAVGNSSPCLLLIYTPAVNSAASWRTVMHKLVTGSLAVAVQPLLTANCHGANQIVVISAQLGSDPDKQMAFANQ